MAAFLLQFEASQSKSIDKVVKFFCVVKNRLPKPCEDVQPLLGGLKHFEMVRLVVQEARPPSSSAACDAFQQCSWASGSLARRPLAGGRAPASSVVPFAQIQPGYRSRAPGLSPGPTASKA